MTVGQLALTASFLAAALTSLIVYMRWPEEQREAGQHAAPRSMIVDVAADVAARNAPPPGYVDPDTDTWLTRPRATGAYDQLAPAALDAAADTIPPGAVATVHAAPLPTWAATGVWSPRLMSPGPRAPGRHRADGPDPAQWLPAPVKPSAPEPFPGDYLDGREDDAADDVPPAAEPLPEPLPEPVPEAPELPGDLLRESESGCNTRIGPAGQRAIDLPVVVWTQLGALTPAQYLDKLFGGDTSA